MEFGVPREVRDLESRVGLTPAGVHTLTQADHTVYIEKGAGIGAGFTDEDYRHAGGQIVYSATEVYGRAAIIAKITRPTAKEHELFQNGQTILSFFHLPSSSPDLYDALVKHEITAISYEMIEEEDGTRPVLMPASEVAGRMAPIIAGEMLRSDRNGRGILLSGLPGVPAAAVVIVGGGILGSNAARAFAGMQAEVTVLDTDPRKLQQIDQHFHGRIGTMYANEYNLKRAVRFADVLIGAVSRPGQRAPVVISRKMVQTMNSKAVIIDFAIDEGGCVATSRPTTLRNSTFVAESVIHYCVPNLTAAFARTTSYAITNAAIPFLIALGSGKIAQLLPRHPALQEGLILYQGLLANEIVGKALGKEIKYELGKPLPS